MVPLGEIGMKEVLKISEPSSPHLQGHFFFLPVTSGRTYMLRANIHQEKQVWMKALKKHMLHYAQHCMTARKKVSKTASKKLNSAGHLQHSGWMHKERKMINTGLVGLFYMTTW